MMNSEVTETEQIVGSSIRKSKLSHYLGELVIAGAKIEEHHNYRAVVLKPQPKNYHFNIIMALIGVAMFAWIGGFLFLAGAFLALAGWHKKLVTGAKYIRTMIRVDETGGVQEIPLATT